MSISQYPTLVLAILSALYGPVISQSGNLTSKRGFGFTADSQSSDIALLLSGRSPIDWYYTWSLSPASTVNNTIPFVPLIHGLDDASQSDLGSLLNELPDSSTHLLTFNEPDGTQGSGGSSISAEDAAKAYINDIVPFRTARRPWKISHPVTTGSGQGLDWLRQFNESCYSIDTKNGCAADFIAVHWYGDFNGLTSWLQTLHEFYGNSTSTAKLEFWVTEFAMPQGGEDATVSMMNQSLSHLDQLDYVEAYAWFGAFRSNTANGFVGDNVALFDDNGALTELGAEYLGGASDGFEKGMGGSAAAPKRISVWAMGLACLTLLLSI